MKSWLINDARKFELVTTNEEHTLKNEAKVKVTRVALSACDLALFNSSSSFLPVVPCRIATGLISESDDFSLKKGQRVMLSPYYRSSNENFLVNGKNRNGYLSDFVVVPTSDIYTLPDGISDESVTFIEDIALNINAYSKLDIDRTQYVLIYSATASNLIFAQLCIYYQAIPIIIDDDAERLQIASDLGVYYCVNTNEDDLITKIKEITSGKMVNHLIINSDCYYHNDDLLKCVAYDGKVAIVGLNTLIDDLNLNVTSIITNNLTIYGVNNGIGELSTAINMLATGIIVIDKLVQKVVEFEQAKDTFVEISNNLNWLKTIIRC